MIGTQSLHLSPAAYRKPVGSHEGFRKPRCAGFIGTGARLCRPLQACRNENFRTLSGKIMFGGVESHSQYTQKQSVLCRAALDSKCSAGQTQTVNRQSTSSTISILGPGIDNTPKLEKGGEDGNPPYDGGGGGGGGGGGSSSGGFFLFAFLLFIRFLRDLEREDMKETREMVVEKDDYTPYTPPGGALEEDDEW